jgi:hypothetical protein
MKFDPEGYRQARWMILALILMFWFFAFTLIKDAFKTRADFKVIGGLVTEEGDTKVKGKGNNYYNVYYFKLSTHGQLLGVGTDNDLKPILDENFTGLTVGDSIQVTFEENWATEKERVNQVVKEIVREGKVIYHIMPRTSWNGRMKVGLVCFAIGTAILTLLFFLNRKYYRVISKVGG